MPKRSYVRRSEEERIAELETRIAELKDRAERKTRKDLPILKESQRLLRALKRFAQFAAEHQRMDLANMTDAFAAGLERAANEEPENKLRRSRGDASAAYG